MPVEFKFENHTVRTVATDGETWFPADVRSSGSKIQAMLLVVSMRMKRATVKTPTLGGTQQMNVVNQFGLYPADPQKQQTQSEAVPALGYSRSSTWIL